MYTFDKNRISVANGNISECTKETLKHFGYDEPIGEAHSPNIRNLESRDQIFEAIGELIGKLGINATRKTRIIFDYDPGFAHIRGGTYVNS